MPKAVLILGILLSVFINGMAQKQYIVEGVVRDSLGNDLSHATVSLFTGKDSLHLITKDDGRFRFTLSSADELDLSVTLKGYTAFKKKFIFPSAAASLKIKSIILSIDYQELDPVTVKKIRPLTIGVDTITYNAGAFTVRDGSPLQSLLKRLPGIELDQEGNLLSRGKKIGKVQVNGNTFFGGNIGLAIQNLPADIIDKIQIIDDYGDRARLTGVKIGEPARILNLVLKQDKRNGVFGNLESGYGTKNKFDNSMFVNAFTGERQLGINGTFADKSPSGKNFSKNANMSYADRWSSKWRQDANANIAVEDPRSSGLSIQDSYYGTGKLHLEQTTQSVTHNNNRGLSGTSTYTPDAFNMLRISPTLSTQENDQHSTVSYFSSQQDSVLNKISNGQSQTEANVQNQSFVTQAYFEHQSQHSKRRFTATMTTQLGENRQFTDSRVNSLVIANARTSQVVDHNIVNSNTSNLNLNSQLNYYAPVGKTGFLELSHSLVYARNDNEKSTRYAADSSSVPQIVDSLSQHYVFHSLEQRWHAGYTANIKLLHINLGIEGQPGLLRGNISGKSALTDYHYFGWQPNAQFSLQLQGARVFSLQYSGSPILPTLQQVQPITDISNPQYPIAGNPFLHTGFAQTVNIQYEQSSLKPLQFMGFGINVGAGTAQNAIVSDITHPNDSSIVLQKTTYTNANGIHTYNAGYHFSLPYIFRLHLRVSLKGDLSAGQSVYYTDHIATRIQSLTGNQSIHIQWMSAEIFESDGFGSYSWSNSSSFHTAAFFWSWQNKVYLLHHAIASIKCSQIMTGNAGSRWQVNPTLVSGSLEWQFGRKNKYACKVTGNDIFNSSNGFIQSVSATSITQSRTVLIGRYFMAGIVWKWGRFNN